jgi:hypothetical protein
VLHFTLQDKNIKKLKPDASSKLHRSVQELVTMLFDIDQMKKTMLEFEVSSSQSSS